MLVLTRSKGEVIRLEDEAGNLIGEIMVCDGRGRIRIGLDLPPSIKIRRESKEPAELETAAA